MIERAFQRRAVSALSIALATAWLAYGAIGGVLGRLGHPCATLDDSFIHFQYARALVEGHPFRYQSGEPFTMGATSLLWPVLLAPFYALGFRDVAILWPAWALSFVALGMLAHEAFHLARRLAGTPCALGTAAMVLSLSAFTWCAASGMEIIPFAWCLARAARRSSEWAEGSANGKRRTELVVLAVIAPLLRPEGAVTSAMIAATLFVFHRERSWRGLWPSALALSAPLLPAALAFTMTGSFATSTAKVKLLPGNPYFVGSALSSEIAKNLRILVGTILNGEAWSAEFLPKGGAWIGMAGLLAISLRGEQSRCRWRAFCVLLMALTIAAPCLYVTFLWNRLRYLWPFATAWLVGLGCLARVIGDALGAIHPRARMASPIACGALSGMFLMQRSGTLDDVVGSASGIDRQQVTLGRWAKRNLPYDARIGVNDTGAIAYLSDRHTFDIVGLTTKSEGRYWVAGAGSRFEHYERLYRESPASLPTHFIVYPEWMACDAVLGRTLYEATVLDSSILGGRTMRVFEADYGLLGSGERPWTTGLDVYDSLDVADLESEKDHEYELLGARDDDETVTTAPSSEGRIVADGGRTHRYAERFCVETPSDSPSTGTVRLMPTNATRVRVLADGVELEAFEVEEGGWAEYTFSLPKRGRQRLELRPEGGSLTVFHYWFSRAI
jgi:hypothetical protein